MSVKTEGKKKNFPNCIVAHFLLDAELTETSPSSRMIGVRKKFFYFSVIQVLGETATQILRTKTES